MTRTYPGTNVSAPAHALGCQSPNLPSTHTLPTYELRQHKSTRSFILACEDHASRSASLTRPCHSMVMELQYSHTSARRIASVEFCAVTVDDGLSPDDACVERSIALHASRRTHAPYYTSVLCYAIIHTLRERRDHGRSSPQHTARL